MIQVTRHAKMRYRQRQAPESDPATEIRAFFKDSKELKWKYKENKAKFYPPLDLVFCYKKERGDYVILTVLRHSEDQVEYANPGKSPDEVMIA